MTCLTHQCKNSIERIRKIGRLRILEDLDGLEDLTNLNFERTLRWNRLIERTKYRASRVTLLSSEGAGKVVLWLGMVRVVW